MENRRAVLKALSASAAFAGLDRMIEPRPAMAQTQTVSIRVNLERSIGRCNTMVLGNNIEWTDGGDGLGTHSGALDPTHMAMVRELSPPLLRYPGGTLSDTYHWRDGLGPIGERRPNRDLSNRMQPVYFGTDEFLRVADAIDANAVITLNVPTGTPEEAADWVRYLNGGNGRPGRAKRRVIYWEVGNEPYLKENNRSDLALSPPQFAERAGAIIKAIKAADPQIKVGVPLRSDHIGGRAATPFQGYNDAVLDRLAGSIDFAALHDAYMPFANDQAYPPLAIYWALMAGTRTVEGDFAATRAALRARAPNKAITLAITEYNAFVSQGKPTDSLISSLAGAIYVADVLRLMATTPDVEFANYWSLSGNWYFGAIDQQGHRRPGYYVLAAFRKLLAGEFVEATVENSPGFSTERVGAVEPQSGIPVLVACATRAGSSCRLLLLNKDIAQPIACDVDLGSAPIAAASAQILTASDPRAGIPGQPAVELRSQQIARRDRAMLVDLPPHSVALVEIRLA